MMTSIKVLVFAAACIGCAAAWHRRRLPLCFFPVTFAAASISVLYVTAFFGALRIAGYAIVAAGLAAFACCARRDTLKAVFSDKSLWFLALGAAWLFAVTRGAMLSHWDDGSHWYRICKAVHYEQALPTTPDILYYDYVPGCALWVYLITHVIGFSIPNCMFANGLPALACLCTLFAGIAQGTKKNVQALAFGMITAAGVTLGCLTVGTYTLMVDLQLSMAAMAALILGLDMGEKKEGLLLMVPSMIFLTAIKSSGLFFAAAVFVWVIRSRRLSGRETAKRAALWLALPLMLFLLYQLRCKVVYAAQQEALQSISLSRYASLLMQKDGAIVTEFTKRFLHRLFVGDTELSMTLYEALWMFLLLGYGLRQEKHLGEADALLESVCSGLIMLAAYAVSLYVLYLFAMNNGEALLVNSFYRYFGSGVIVFIGVNLYAALRQITRMNGNQVFIVGMMLAVVMGMPGAYSKKYVAGAAEYRILEDYRSDLWRGFQYYIPENKEYTPDSYVVLWDRNQYYGGARENLRVEYIAGAWLRADKVMAVERSQLQGGADEAVIKALDTYDYLVVISDFSGSAQELLPYFDETQLSEGLHKL